MSNAKHQRIDFEYNHNFDNSTDPTTKAPFAVGESVVVCRDKNSLISTRSLDANEYLCPFCNKQLDSNLVIIGSAKSDGGKKSAPAYPPPIQPQQRSSNMAPLLWVGLVIAALALFVFATTGVLAALGSSGGAPNAPESTDYQPPTLAPEQSVVPRSTNTTRPEPSSTIIPRNTARPAPTKTLAPQNLGDAEVSNEIYFAALRKSPGYVGKNDQKDVIAEVPSGSIVTMLDGPKKADGINWWYVEWNGYEGWMAERTGSGKTILIFN